MAQWVKDLAMAQVTVVAWVQFPAWELHATGTVKKKKKKKKGNIYIKIPIVPQLTNHPQLPKGKLTWLKTQNGMIKYIQKDKGIKSDE